MRHGLYMALMALDLLFITVVRPPSFMGLLPKPCMTVLSMVTLRWLRFLELTRHKVKVLPMLLDCILTRLRMTV